MTQQPPPPGDPQYGQGQPAPQQQPAYGEPAHGQQPAYGQQPGYGQPQAGGAHASQLPNAPGAVVSLVLGLLSVFACLNILGPVALVMGRNAEKRVESGGGAYGGKGIATGGKILGIIGTIFLILFILFVVLIALTGNFTYTYDVD